MIWLALGALLLAGFVMLGRASSRSGGGGDWRVAGGVIAIAALIGAAVLAVRGSYLPAAGLAFAALTAASLSRRPPPGPRRRREAPRITMSEHEARAVLGVGPDADAEAIQAAYVRLMRRVHPDAGGAAGLAAQLNAARDKLMRP